MSQQATVPTQITMYSTPWCGYCHRLRGQLDREGIAYAVVDIEEHPEAAAYVREVNDGNQTVPTVVFPDGSRADQPEPRAGPARECAAPEASPAGRAVRERAAVPVLHEPPRDRDPPAGSSTSPDAIASAQLARG